MNKPLSQFWITSISGTYRLISFSLYIFYFRFQIKVKQFVNTILAYLYFKLNISLKAAVAEAKFNIQKLKHG